MIVEARPLLSLDQYINFILRHRWLTTLLALLVMLAMTSGARYLGVTNDYRSLFSEDNPRVARRH